MTAISKTGDADLASVKRLGTRDARNHFSDLIGQVHYTGEPIIIERAGKDMVVMLAVETYAELLTHKAASSINWQDGIQDDQQIAEPLCGAFPELAAITDDDLIWVKQLWNQSLEKQERIIAGLEPSEAEA